jgi:hypothetical protein
MLHITAAVAPGNRLIVISIIGTVIKEYYFHGRGGGRTDGFERPFYFQAFVEKRNNDR